jgi:RNA polymerase sigma-70 factor (ECF subfamily)
VQAAKQLEAVLAPLPIGALSFEAVYEAHFPFVARLLRRLGVPEAALDDALQDTFVVVHRRLPEFEGRATLKTWLSRIAVNIASDHRRLRRRKGGGEPLDEGVPAPGPDALALVEQSQAVAQLYRLLGELDEPQRTVFVLAELEELSAPEISEAIGVKLNTVYSRLRTARQRFEAALARDKGGER